MFDYFVNIRVQAWIRTGYLRRVGVLADFKENVWLLRESEQIGKDLIIFKFLSIVNCLGYISRASAAEKQTKKSTSLYSR